MHCACRIRSGDFFPQTRWTGSRPEEKAKSLRVEEARARRRGRKLLDLVAGASTHDGSDPAAASSGQRRSAAKETALPVTL